MVRAKIFIPDKYLYTLTESQFLLTCTAPTTTPTLLESGLILFRDGDRLRKIARVVIRAPLYDLITFQNDKILVQVFFLSVEGFLHGIYLVFIKHLHYTEQ